MMFMVVVILLADFGFSRPGEVQAEELNFTILYTGDEHSALIPHSPAINYHPDKSDNTIGGFARLKNLISQVRSEREAEDESTLLVSSGDFHSGNLFSWLSFREMAPELDLMQKMGYDVVTLGNHEFDFGADFISQYLNWAGYPEKKDETTLLASNSYIPEDHSLSDRGIKKNHLKELPNGLKVGFFGLLGEDGQYFIFDSEPVEFTPAETAARENIEALEAKGADVIVAVNHSGYEYNASLAEEVDGMDVIIGGHSHVPMYNPEEVNDTIILEPGSHGEYLGKIMLGYDREEDQIRVRNDDYNTPHLTRIDHRMRKDERIKEEVEYYTGQLNDLLSEVTHGRFDDILEPVATSENIIRSRPRDRETPMGNLTADSMRLSVQGLTDKEEVDFAFQANGQIRGDVIPGSTQGVENKVSIYDLARLAGLGKTGDRDPGYPLAKVYLTGEEIYTLLELSAFLTDYMDDALFMQVSGLRYTYDPDRAVLFNLPVLDFPVPTFRSIQMVEKYIGEGAQTVDSAPDNYEPVMNDDSRLYSVVIDTYIYEFLPEVGERIPHVSIEPRNERGEPILDIETAKVKINNSPYTAWQGLLDYSREEGDISYYYETTDRIMTTSLFNLMYLVYGVVGGIVAVLVGMYVIERKIH